MRIGEVAEQTGLSISNIRFYEKKGLIAPEREQQSKYRDYTKEDVKRLKQIILYRKMDFPIEAISSMVNGEASLESLLAQQIEALKEKQKMIQGSMDLCRKVAEDGCCDEWNVDFYLSYVKEEEENGTRFAELDELLTELADFTQYDRMVGTFLGDPFVGQIFANPWLNRLIRGLWVIAWIALPVIVIVDYWLDSREANPGMVLLFLLIWLFSFVVPFISGRKRR